MRIGIITFHFAHNFGAVIQCYCLQEFLRQKGHEVSVINYLPPKITRYYDVYYDPIKYGSMRYSTLREQGFPRQKAILKAFISAGNAWRKNTKILFRYKRKKSFEYFTSSFLNLTKPFYSFSELKENCSDYDVLICGSDQIWNTKLLDGKFDPAFFLHFAVHCQTKIAYGPSWGDTNPIDYSTELPSLLSDFDSVSVREKQDVAKLESVLKRKVDCVLDPVFLAGPDDFLKIQPFISQSDHYILIYALHNDRRFYETAKQLAKGRKIIDVSPIKIFWGQSLSKQNTPSIRPDEFLSLIAGADHILTNSFHGTALSIILKKDFYVFPLAVRNERIDNILSITGLTNRYIIDCDRIDETPIDYQNVNSALSLERKKSMDYLVDSLKCKKQIEVEETKSASRIILRSGRDCCGCGTCFSVCKQNAITIRYDQEGFLEPDINIDKCIQCAICIKACNMAHNRCSDNAPVAYYAFQNNNDIMESASGGAWPAIAKECINNGGKAIGAVWSADISKVRHSIASDNHDVLSQRGSKYIEGAAFETFHEIGNLLRKKTAVVFSGLPCECNALKAYLSINKIQDDNLIVVDLICHGKSSPAIWNSYLKVIKDKYKSPIRHFTFRDKKQSWHGIHERIELANGRVITLTKEAHSIGKIMETEAMLRESCYECPYAKLSRAGNITIGDFWGIEKQLPSWGDTKGTSLVFANDIKGEKFMEKMLKDNYRHKEIDKPSELQKNLREPTQRPLNRDRFWKEYSSSSNDAFIKKFMHQTCKEAIKMRLKHFFYFIKNKE